MIRVNSARTILLLACVFIAVVDEREAHAQPQLIEDYTSEQIKVFFQRTVQEYAFDGDEELNLKLLKQPIIVTSNEAGIPIRGSIFLWTEDDCPAVLVNMFTFRIGDRFWYRHGVNSLLEKPLTANLNGREVWTPKAAELDWNKEESLVPASNERVRLRQMRTIARKFHGDFEDLQPEDTKKNPLHLMPQPLYRYKSDSRQIIDGALMALATETKPVVYLLIEARGNTQEETHYQWALIRNHYVPINVYVEDELVWSTKRIQIIERTLEGQQPYSNDPFFAFFSRDPIPPPDELERD